MGFCTHCGNHLGEADRFCERCGAPATPRVRPAVAAAVVAVPAEEPREKLYCELAYTGALFWVPLILCPGEKNARFHANQGLWVLIVATIACSAVSALGAVSGALTGAAGAAFGAVHALGYAVFLPFMAYLLWSCVTRALAIHRDESARPILFFDRLTLIASR